MIARLAGGIGLVWILVTVSTTMAYAQSPWLRSRAGFYVQATFQTIPRYDALFLERGGIQPLDRRLTENTVQLYGEYGLNRHTTLIVNVPWRFQQARQFLENTPQPLTDAGYLRGWGNISLGIRQLLLQKRLPLTASLRVDAPVDNYNDNSGLRTGYKAFTFLPLLSTGQKFSTVYWFGYAGFALRTNGYSPYVNTGAEAGYHFKKLWFVAFSELVLPVSTSHSPDLSINNLRTGLYVNEQGYWSIGLKAIIELHRFWGLTVSGSGIAWGERVPEKKTVSVGAYFKWD